MQLPHFSFRSVWLTGLVVSAFGLAGCQQPPAPATPAQTTPAPVTATPSSTPGLLTGDVVSASPAPVAVAASPAPAAPTAAPAAASAASGALEITQGKDYELALLDSSKLKLSKLLGRRKVVIVNFWATWCGPCRREIPELVALQKIYQGNAEVEFIGLSIEDPEQFRDQVKAFAKQLEINYKVGFAPNPMFLAFNGTDPNAAIPQTLIFGKDGKLFHHLRGLRPAFKDYVQQYVDIALRS